MKNSDSELIIREYILGIEMLKKISLRAKNIINELSETWLQKNKISLLQKTIQMFTKDIDFAQAQIEKDN
ncbi:MAG: hypothetical protein IJ470_03475 [Clostridia bacterium]|nr:hypothetical protein [Clostridia bacterium]